MKRLYKFKEGKQVSGVCLGIAEVYNLDPTIVRLVTFGLLLIFPPTLIFYLVADVVMPSKNEETNKWL